MKLVATWAVAFLVAAPLALNADDKPNAEVKKPKKSKSVGFNIGDQAPEFVFKDSSGEKIELSKLTAKGPVLIRLTCGCAGCDRELPYFQAMHEAYGEQGLVSLAVFREPDDKVEEYVKQKKVDMRYTVDSKGESWKTFKTTTMPTNFLIDRGGKIVAIAAGCDPSGLIAKKLSEKVAKVVDAPNVDVQKKVNEQK